MTMQEIWSDHNGVWTGVYKYGAIVLFGAAMFGAGASAGTAIFHVPVLWHQAAIAHHDETVVIPAIKGAQSHLRQDVPIDCMPHPEPKPD